MGNRTFGFKQFMYYTVLIVGLCLIVQILARLTWASIITFGAWLPTMLTTGISSVSTNGFWGLFAQYTPDFPMIAVTQAVGVAVVIVIVALYKERQRKKPK